MLQGTTGARKRAPSAINVLRNSHSCLLSNCTAGSNPEMFPPQLRELVKQMPDAFPTRFLGAWSIALKVTVVKEKSAWFWYQQSLAVRGKEHDGEQEEGGMDWAGWNQGQEHPQLDMLLSQLRSLTKVQSTMCIQHSPDQSWLSLIWIHLQPSVSQALACVHRHLYHRGLGKFPAYRSANVSCR